VEKLLLILMSQMTTHRYRHYRPAQAIEIAIRQVNAQLYMWQDAGMEQQIKNQMGNAGASYAPTATLVWFNDGDEISPRDLRLAFKVDVYAKQPLSRADYFIDAKNGNYLGKKDKIFYSDVTGTASTAYSGSQTIHSDLVSANNYRLRDYTKGSGIITLHGESASRGTDYTSTSANWTLTGTNIAALDAHYGVSQTYAFYKANFNRNSYNGTGGSIVQLCE
jgi:Zn-dependent metalloprotease